MTRFSSIFEYFSNFVIPILFCGLIIITCLYCYLKFFIFNFWNRLKVQSVAPTIILGNINLDFILGKTTIGDLVKEHYNKFRKLRFFGIYIFQNPILVINDPELIRLILVKDFQYFADRGIHSNVDVDPMTFNLFRVSGERWKPLRAKLTHIFTSGKLKQLHPLLLEVSNEFIEICKNSLKHRNILDMKDLVERFISDYICTVAFGFKGDCLKNPESEFRKYGLLSSQIGKYSAVLSIFGSNILDFLHLPVFKKSVNNFFIRIFQEVVEYRIKEKIVRNDFINSLMELIDCGNLSDNPSDKDEGFHDSGHKLNMLEAAAQVFVFFVAGYETTSTTITYCLHELVKYPEIQKKLQEEIDEFAKTPEGFDYENLMNMKYTDMVFNEALRKHPALPFINRLCTKDYTIPNSSVRIPKGTRIAVSVSGLQNDPDIYPDPERFDPARFTKESCTGRSSYYFLPFGEGPRICIGQRIALMQGKLALVTLLSKFEFSICEETLMPLPYSNHTFLQVPKDGLYLRVRERVLNF